MTGAGAEGDLAQRLVAFGGVLRGRGVTVPPERVADGLRALRSLGRPDGAAGYAALRCVFASRQEDLPIFDRAFAEYWLGRMPTGGRDEHEQARDDVSPRSDRDASGGGRPEQGASAAADPGDRQADATAAAGTAFSARERLRTLDFADYGPDELRAARGAMERIARQLPRRVTRRLEPGRRGDRLDARRTLTESLRTHGTPLRRAWRRPRTRPLELVLVLDVSGSMERYARALLTFALAAVHADRRVEAFTFGTRLTRVTAELAERHPDRALAAVTRAVPDWSSGTRIGENLRTLNERWGSRGLTRGAIVAILSDGWERGDPAVLADELARLRRAARGVVWVNPLAGEEGYEPLAAGMASAMPHLDRLLPGNDMAALEDLVAVAASLARCQPAPMASRRAA